MLRPPGTKAALEGAVAVAQQERHVVRIPIGDGQVGNPIAVEVSRDHLDRIAPHRVCALRLESAVARA